MLPADSDQSVFIHLHAGAPPLGHLYRPVPLGKERSKSGAGTHLKHKGYKCIKDGQLFISLCRSQSTAPALLLSQGAITVNVGEPGAQWPRSLDLLLSAATPNFQAPLCAKDSAPLSWLAANSSCSGL